MRSRPHPRRDQAYLVTEAPQSRAAELRQRERRYFLMMGIRVVCFIVTVIMFLNHAGWLTVIPAIGAIALPYFAVVVANTKTSGSPSRFRPYQPNLPERYVPPSEDDAGDGAPGGNG